MDTKALIKLAGGFTRSGSCSRGCVCAPKHCFSQNRTNEPNWRMLAKQIHSNDSHATAIVTTCRSWLWLCECANMRSILYKANTNWLKYLIFILKRALYFYYTPIVKQVNRQSGKNGDGEAEKEVRVRQDVYVSGILSANGLIYHRPRCYGNQHSGQIMGCWSCVFFLFFFFLRPSWRDLWVYPVCITDGKRRRGLGKVVL